MKRTRLGKMVLVMLLLTFGGTAFANVLPQDGVRRQYYADGTLQTLWKYKNGMLTLKRSYYRNGQMLLERRYKNGTIVFWRRFYENGRLQSVWDARTRTIKVYTPEGRLKDVITRGSSDPDGP